MKVALLLVWMTVLCMSAGAEDLHVDPVLGDDSAAGSASAPLRSISEALARLGPLPTPTAPDRVWLLPGLHDASAGNQFPIYLRDALELRGMGAADEALIHTDRGAALIADTMISGAMPAGIVIHGVRVTGGYTGIWIHVRNSDRAVAEISHVSGESISACVLAETKEQSSLDLTVEHSDFEGAFSGISLAAFFMSSMTFAGRDCMMHDCLRGALVNTMGTPIQEITFDRCRFEFNESGLIGTPNTSVRDCLFRGNDQGVFSYHGPFFLSRCTVAGNLTGLRFWLNGDLHVSQCIVAENLDDVVYDQPIGGMQLVEDSLFQEGDFVGTNGNFSANPMFRDSFAQDYRLSLGSPCVDRVAAAPLELDLEGVRRNLDGDLDTLAMGDLGAFEMQILEGPDEVSPGQPFSFELMGPANEFFQLAFSRTGLAPTPLATVYGSFQLNLSDFERFAPLPIAANGTASVPLAFPASPALIGTTPAFQALLRKPSAPAGGALSNALSLTIIP